ncbi:MAG: hypothetical protein KGL39_18105 [Patescibacteria group bacterium]|nr:hypothetical protein [Patescibacteria group bacterium]
MDLKSVTYVWHKRLKLFGRITRVHSNGRDVEVLVCGPRGGGGTVTWFGENITPSGRPPAGEPAKPER